MDHANYYNDRKYCDGCQDYVAYLMGLEESYCVECGGQVRLFSPKDWEQFHEQLAASRPRGGRPRKNAKKPAPKSSPKSTKDTGDGKRESA
jgi:hypothetical protein